MNIGIDITPVMYDRGVSRYTSNLVTALAQRSDVTLSLYGSSWRQAAQLEHFARSIQKRMLGRATRCEYRIQHYPPSVQNFLWNTLHVNSVRSLLPRLNVFHSWDWLQPPDRDMPLVSTIHDLAILKFPETAHPDIVKMHQQSWKILKDRGAEIIAVSHTTKKDIVELLNFPNDRVHVIYEALPQETVTVTEALTEEKYEEFKNRLHLQRPFILFVGTREPRKNLKRLMSAWEPLQNDVDLLVAGETGWDETTSQHSSAHLRFLGKVSHQELAVLYGEAVLLAYPSLYEGFGLPILEAFYHGTPVLTSNTSSMPEVAGNAAELVNPLSVEDIRAGLQRVLGESRDEQQRRLQKMIIRLQLFHWQRVADETMRVYAAAINAGKP